MYSKMNYIIHCQNVFFMVINPIEAILFLVPLYITAGLLSTVVSIRYNLKMNYVIFMTEFGVRIQRRIIVWEKT